MDLSVEQRSTNVATYSRLLIVATAWALAHPAMVCAQNPTSQPSSNGKNEPGGVTTVTDVHLDQLRERGVEGHCRVIGDLGKPLGSVIIAQGIIVSRNTKLDAEQFRALRINGHATQDTASIPISAYFDTALPSLKVGSYYEFEGYETGAFVGVPGDAWERAGKIFQTTGFHFRNTFVVFRARCISAMSDGPADFRDRQALLQGVAVARRSHAEIVGSGWRLIVDGAKPWAKDVEGKQVEAFGVIRSTDDDEIWRVENGWTRLVDLRDQVDCEVTLRGTAHFPRGDAGIFDYRGTDIYIDGLSESDRSEWRKRADAPVVIRGRLEEAMLPDLREDIGRESPTLKKYYVVRDASWEPLDVLLTPELPQTPTGSATP